MEPLAPTVARVRDYCIKKHCLPYGRIVVAVSGGADSLTLLHIILTLSKEFRVLPYVATFDHGIRGAAGAEDVKFVREIAMKWGVPVAAGAADVPALAREWHMGLEEAARKARYSFLREIVSDVKATSIATGHNQDDQAETVLMHLIRGSGLAGLRGIMPVSSFYGRGLLVRPLLGIARAEIDEYVRGLGIQPRVDASNSDPHYTRNRIRHDVLPLLAEINPQVRAALARTADTLRDDYAALMYLRPGWKTAISGYSVDRALLLGMPIAQRRLYIRDLAQAFAPEVMLTLERIDAALETAEKGGKIQLGGNLWLVATPTEVNVRAEPTLPYPDNCPSLVAGTFISINGDGTYMLPESDWQLIVERIKANSAVDALTIILPIADEQKVALRTRYRGDRFAPLGLSGHSQKIKETLINIKIAAEWRDLIPLVVVDDEIAAFIAPTEGGPIQRVSHSFAVTPDDPRPLWRFNFVQISQQTKL